MSAREKVLWLDAAAGASGDMILGALVDLGASFAAIKRTVASLGLVGVRLSRHAVVRGAVSATKIDVTVAGHPHDDHHVHGKPARNRHGHERSHGHDHGRTLSDIRNIVASAPLAPPIRDRALVIFRRLVEAEAEAHGLTVRSVHLHEAGAADAIADVVGVCAALAAIGPDRIVVSPMTTGSGTVACAHGIYPVPGPATSLLLRGAPLTGIEAQGERLTPTGAAILTSIAHEYGGPPSMTLRGVGHGAGSREYPERPNVVRALLGEREVEGATAAAPQIPQVLVVDFTVDDATPQLLAYASERLFAAGAQDVYTTPVQMKKGRAAHHVTALTQMAHFDTVTRAALTETTTLGLRFHLEGRIELDRAIERVATAYGAIDVKVGRLDGAEVHATPEYEQCAAAARKHGVPLFVVQQAALAARRVATPRARKKRR
jgi:pyridinium-3,5-bisthiocarboxylic acid mononucleotide nickel chelatase